MIFEPTINKTPMSLHSFSDLTSSKIIA